MRSALLLVLVLPMLEMAVAAAGGAGEPTVQLQLTVTVRSQADGSPIDRLGIVVAGEDEPSRALTDAAGMARFDLTVPVDKRRLVVALSETGGMQPVESMDEFVEQMDSGMERFKEVTAQYSFRQYYIVPIPEGQGQLSLEIPARPAVRVTGRLVDPDGGGVSGVVTRSDSPMSLFSEKAVRDDHGNFVLAGVPQGHDSFIYISTPSGDCVKVIHLPDSQSVEDVDLGLVPVPEPISGTVPIRLTVTNIDAVPWVPTMKRWWVTIVSRDGQLVVEFPINLEGVGQSSADGGGATGDKSPKLPAGAYYAVSGPSHWNRAADSLIRLARAGRAADLDAAGVARFEVKGSGQVDVTVDAAATEQAIFTLYPEH